MTGSDIHLVMCTACHRQVKWTLHWILGDGRNQGWPHITWKSGGISLVRYCTDGRDVERCVSRQWTKNWVEMYCPMCLWLQTLIRNHSQSNSYHSSLTCISQSGIPLQRGGQEQHEAPHQSLGQSLSSQMILMAMYESICMPECT